MPPTEWPIRGVDDVRRAESDGLATGPFGSSVSAKFFQSSGVPLIRGSNLSLDVGERLLEDDFVFVSEEKVAEFPRAVARVGDLVFTCWGTIGQVGLVDGRARYDRYLISNKQMKLSPDPSKADSLFLYYLFQSPDMQATISGVGIGSSVPGFNLGQLRGLRFPLPPLREQRAITALLGALDDKIEQNRRTGRALEGLARATFKAWFVDFEPVKAKAAGQTTFPGMPPAAFAALPERLVDSPHGSVPMGWNHVPLGQLVTLQRGKTYKSAFKGQPGPYLLGLGSIHRNGGFKDDALSTYGGESPENLLLRSGDVYASLKDVTQSADLLGAVARVPPDFGIGRLTQDTVRLVPKATFPSHITYQQLLTPAYRDYCRGCATGTTNLGLSREDFLSYPIVMPPTAIAKAYEQLAESLSQLQAHQRTESRKLAALRDYLLPRLLSGRVRVRDAEREVADAS